MQENEEEPIFINVQSAAMLVGIGKRLMLDIIKQDDFFPAVKFGKRNIKVNKKQLIEWANNLTSVNWAVVKTIKEI